MADSRVSLRLIGENRKYLPGDTLSGEYYVEVHDPSDVRAVEVSVLWYTEGKGDEDMAMHDFSRITNDDGSYVDVRNTQHFSSELPKSPLSYDGVVVKLHWCVRVRIFLAKDKEIVSEQPFTLGEVPRARPVE